MSRVLGGRLFDTVWENEPVFGTVKAAQSRWALVYRVPAGFGHPQCGHARASVLTIFPHSRQFVSAKQIPPVSDYGKREAVIDLVNYTQL